MNEKNIAIDFLKSFCDGSIENLASFLAEDLEFIGPYLQAESKKQYIDSLVSNPPEKAELFVIKTITEGKNVSVLYDYKKPSFTTRISQYFMIQDGKISETHLVFDTQQNTEPGSGGNG